MLMVVFRTIAVPVAAAPLAPLAPDPTAPVPTAPAPPRGTVVVVALPEATVVVIEAFTDTMAVWVPALALVGLPAPPPTTAPPALLAEVLVAGVLGEEASEEATPPVAPKRPE